MKNPSLGRSWPWDFVVSGHLAVLCAHGATFHVSGSFGTKCRTPSRPNRPGGSLPSTADSSPIGSGLCGLVVGVEVVEEVQGGGLQGCEGGGGCGGQGLFGVGVADPFGEDGQGGVVV